MNHGQGSQAVQCRVADFTELVGACENSRSETTQRPSDLTTMYPHSIGSTTVVIFRVPMATLTFVYEYLKRDHVTCPKGTTECMSLRLAQSNIPVSVHGQMLHHSFSQFKESYYTPAAIAQQLTI